MYMHESVTEVTVKGQTYCVPTAILDAALLTFNQNYGRGINVPELALQVAYEFRDQFGQHDPFSVTRLQRCILSLKGKRGGKKKQAKKPTKPQSDEQLELWT